MFSFQDFAQEAAFGVRNKKPFCNAFTGCGRKRSDPDVAEGELLGMLAERIQGIRDQVGRNPLIILPNPSMKNGGKMEENSYNI